MKDNSSQPFRHLLPGGGGWLSKVLGALLAVGIIVASAFLAAFFFGFFLVIVAIASIWLAWQRWRLRRWVRANRQHTQADDSAEPQVIIGEYEVIEEPESKRTGSKQHSKHEANHASSGKHHDQPGDADSKKPHR